MFLARPCITCTSKPLLSANATVIWRSTTARGMHYGAFRGVEDFENRFGLKRAGPRNGVARSLQERGIFSRRGYQSTSGSNEDGSTSKSTPSKPVAPRATTRVNDTSLKSGSTSTSELPSSSSQPPFSSQSPTPTQPSTTKTAVDLGGDTTHKTNAEQRKADWRIVKNLAGNLWPRGWAPEARSTKIRVLGALGLLAGGKVSTQTSAEKLYIYH
jgi:hypothetical protein